MTSKEGEITCEYANKHVPIINEDNSFIIDIVDDLILKIDEISKIDSNKIDNNEFEVIAYTNENFVRKNDYLDTIDENSTDATISDLIEEELHVIDVGDSEGIVVERSIEAGTGNASDVHIVDSG